MIDLVIIKHTATQITIAMKHKVLAAVMLIKLLNG